MNESKFYQTQRNKYFALYKTAQTKEAKKDCLRILEWYSKKLDDYGFNRLNREVIIDNALFQERLMRHFVRELKNSYEKYIEILEQQLKTGTTTIKEKNEMIQRLLNLSQNLLEENSELKLYANIILRSEE